MKRNSAAVGICRTTNETYISLFCHNDETCNLPRGVTPKRSNQQNDSSERSLFFISVWLCCFHSTIPSAVRKGDTLRSYVTPTRLPLTTTSNWVSSFALSTVIGEQKQLVSRITTRENPIFTWRTYYPFYASRVQFRAFLRRIKSPRSVNLSFRITSFELSGR